MTETRAVRQDMANRLFFKLYQCANMLHKTGSKAVQDEGLTTQQWAVLGALSRTEAADGIGVGELARYLKVSRQSLAGLLARMARDGHIDIVPGAQDKRSRLVRMTPNGQHVWQDLAQPKIRSYYAAAVDDFSVSDMASTLHYLNKLLDNLSALDEAGGEGERAEALEE